MALYSPKARSRDCQRGRACEHSGECQKRGGAWCDTHLSFECVVCVEGKRNTRCDIRTSKLS